MRFFHSSPVIFVDTEIVFDDIGSKNKTEQNFQLVFTKMSYDQTPKIKWFENLEESNPDSSDMSNHGSLKKWKGVKQP